MDRKARWCIALAPWLIAGSAVAQTHLVFDTAGNIVGSYSSSLVNKIGSAAASWSSVENAAGGAFTRATGTFTAGATVSGSRFLMSGAVAQSFTGAELASAVVQGARGGLIGAAVAGAAYLALQQAHVYFDSAQQSMMYAPPPTVSGNPGIWYFPDGFVGGSGSASGMCEQARALVQAQHPGWADGGFHAVLEGIQGSGNGRTCNIQREGGGYSNVDYSHSMSLQSPSGGDPTQNACPNGVQFNNTTQCAQGVTDSTANGYVGPQITPSNGPAIGQDLISKGQGIQTSSAPQINLQPGTGPTTTVTNPDGSHTTTTSSSTASCTNNVCNLTVNNVSTTYNAQNQVTTGPVTTTVTPAQEPANSTPSEDDKTKPCGLPSTPPCKLDETGVKEAGQPGLDAGKTTTDGLDAQKSKWDAVASGGGAASAGIPGLQDFVAPTEHGGPSTLNSVIPDGSGSCSPLTTNWGSRALTFDWCPLVNYTKPAIDWFAAALTIFTLWGIWVGSARSGGKGA